MEDKSELPTLSIESPASTTADSPVSKEEKEEILPEAPKEPTADEKEWRRLHTLMIDSMEGRLESSIGIKEDYWKHRDAFMQFEHKLKG